MNAIDAKCSSFLLMTLSASLGWISPVRGDDVVLAPAASYAEIDTRLTNEAVRTLSSGSSDAKATVIAAIVGNAKDYAPPALYALSKALFDEGRKDEGAFWFYAGQLRGEFDANRCADRSAADAAGALDDQYGTPINQYMFDRPRELAKMVDRVIEWDKKTPHNYDPRWINLHGMQATLSTMSGKVTAADAPMSVPPSEWDKIEEQTRADYISGFKQAMAQFEASKKPQ